ncbi:MAG: hypothetical protein HYV19_02860 [Gemmatimonadetes bacterium]|nr:hypothetical protein [Gemmatimonadota bacterium]
MRVQLVQDGELVDGLVLAIGFQQLIGEEETDVILIGAEVGELLERAERLVLVAGLLHAVGILEEVLLGVAVESLGRRDLAELVVDRGAPRRGAQHLVAQRDRVVEEPAFGVQIDGALVERHRLGRLALPHEQVAHAVVERDFDFGLTARVVDVKDLAIRGDRLVDLLGGFEVGGLLF